MMHAMEIFRDEVVDKHNVVDRPDPAASFDELNDLLAYEQLEELERRFAA